jgi:DNA-binding NarL/FixJ family response regulator
LTSVLAVDDRATDRDLLASVLRDAGHDVLEAATGERAVELARALRPDLVIADILIPTMDGYEFVRALRHDPTTAAVPVVFYTEAHLIEEVRLLASASGVSHVLVKPPEPEEIIHIVSEALSSGPGPMVPPPPEEFPLEQLRLLNAKLLQKAEALRDAVILAGILQEQLDRGGERAARAAFSADEIRAEALLSNRELEVLAMIAEGATNAEIARRLVIAETTVQSHVKKILRKLGVRNRTQAAARYLRG